MRYALLRHKDRQVKVYSHPDEALTAMKPHDQLFVGRSFVDLQKIFPELAGLEEDVRPDKKEEKRQPTTPSRAVAEGAPPPSRGPGRRSSPGLTEPQRDRNVGSAP